VFRTQQNLSAKLCIRCSLEIILVRGRVVAVVILLMTVNVSFLNQGRPVHERSREGVFPLPPKPPAAQIIL